MTTWPDDAASRQIRYRRCNSLHCGPSRSTAIYRLYDRDERLLYAGIAYDVKKRWREHALDKPWWGEVRWKTALWHETRLGAAVEEYCAIKYENPQYNKQRDYDHRLGVEPTLCDAKIEPRPAPFTALSFAKRHAEGESQGLPDLTHYAAVIAPLPGDPESAHRLWLPQVPELGVRRYLPGCVGPVADTYSDSDWTACRFWDPALELLEKYNGYKGEVSLTVHHADECPVPDFAPGADPETWPGAVFKRHLAEMDAKRAPAPQPSPWKRLLSALTPNAQSAS